MLGPAAWRLWRDFRRCPPGLAFNPLLYRSFRMVGTFAVLLAAGALLARWPAG